MTDDFENEDLKKLFSTIKKEMNENKINLEKNNEKLQSICDYLEKKQTEYKPFQLPPFPFSQTPIFLETKNNNHKKLIKMQLNNDTYCILEDNHYGIGKLYFVDESNKEINIPTEVCVYSINKITKIKSVIQPKTEQFFCMCWEYEYEIKYLDKTYTFINKPCWDIYTT